ncbi:low temperature requirement protein A [Deinococcus rubellus]|uniref:Low temperature requirement protein A n=1 Tax=Deinococcus rubellus TaxID=1889240 RepID=A0ABY5YMP7_9DEIO|nr:low temperature requirement protein A [Deinococcus rubellus]UWX65033.1 low temperature requirement protein A [Deinococcus rubellus]
MSAAHPAAGGPETGQAKADQEAKLPNQEQRATWLELFFDLVFVTALAQLARRFTDDTTLRGFSIFALMFVSVWWAWVGNTLFAGRYGNEGRPYRWGTALQLLSVGGLALGVLGDLKDVGGFFSVLFAVNRFVLVGMYAAQIKDAPSPELARAQFRTFGLSALIWLGSAWLPLGWQQVAWGCAVGVDAVASMVSRRVQAQNLPHPEHLPERVGLLTIISLGAIITEIVGGAGNQKLTLIGQLPAGLSLLITLVLFKLYFDEARDLPVLLAHRDGRVGTLLLWLYTHLPLTLALTALGVGIGHGIANQGPEADQHERVIVALSLTTIFLNLAALRLVTQHALGKLRMDLSIWALLLGGAAMLGLMFVPLGTLPYQAATLAVCGLALLAVWRDPARQFLSRTEEAVAEETHADESAADDGSSGHSSNQGRSAQATTPET